LCTTEERTLSAMVNILAFDRTALLQENSMSAVTHDPLTHTITAHDPVSMTYDPSV